MASDVHDAQNSFFFLFAYSNYQESFEFIPVLFRDCSSSTSDLDLDCFWWNLSGRGDYF